MIRHRRVDLGPFGHAQQWTRRRRLRPPRGRPPPSAMARRSLRETTLPWRLPDEPSAVRSPTAPPASDWSSRPAAVHPPAPSRRRIPNPARRGPRQAPTGFSRTMSLPVRRPRANKADWVVPAAGFEPDSPGLQIRRSTRSSKLASSNCRAASRSVAALDRCSQTIGRRALVIIARYCTLAVSKYARGAFETATNCYMPFRPSASC